METPEETQVEEFVMDMSPAEDWFAVFEDEEPVPLVCWARTLGGKVAGMVVQDNEICPAPVLPDFVTYKHISQFDEITLISGSDFNCNCDFCKGLGYSL